MNNVKTEKGICDVCKKEEKTFSYYAFAFADTKIKSVKKIKGFGV